jgi:hypothetical protein
VLIFTDPARSVEETGSIELQRSRKEKKDIIQVEVRVPAASGVLPEKKSRRANGATQFFQSNGNFEYSLRLNLVIASRSQIHRRAIAEVLQRNSTRLQPQPRIPSEDPVGFIRDQIRECTKLFLLEKGPMCGLQETQDGKTLSSVAGCTLALIHQKYGVEDKDAAELSLRLADFSLKGQHPRGLFYQSYQISAQSWLAPGFSAAISLASSAAVAVRLLRLAATLRSKGVPFNRYFQAASHMADALLSSGRNLKDLTDLLYPDSLLSAGRSENPLSLIELFLELYKFTGKGLYAKAVANLQSVFFSRPLVYIPLTGWDRRSDLSSALLEAQAAVCIAESEYKVKDLDCYLDALLSWLDLNNPDSASEFNPFGGFRHTLNDTTLLFRGFELAYTLLKLGALSKKSARLPEMNLLVSQVLSFTLQKPLGTSYYDPENRGGFGQLNSRIWTNELYYLTRLLEEFPEVFSAKWIGAQKSPGNRS